MFVQELIAACRLFVLFWGVGEAAPLVRTSQPAWRQWPLYCSSCGGATTTSSVVTPSLRTRRQHRTSSDERQTYTAFRNCNRADEEVGDTRVGGITLPFESRHTDNPSATAQRGYNNFHQRACRRRSFSASLHRKNNDFLASSRYSVKLGLAELEELLCLGSWNLHLEPSELSETETKQRTVCQKKQLTFALLELQWLNNCCDDFQVSLDRTLRELTITLLRCICQPSIPSFDIISKHRALLQFATLLGQHKSPATAGSRCDLSRRLFCLGGKLHNQGSPSHHLSKVPNCPLPAHVVRGNNLPRPVPPPRRLVVPPPPFSSPPLPTDLFGFLC